MFSFWGWDHFTTGFWFSAMLKYEALLKKWSEPEVRGTDAKIRWGEENRLDFSKNVGQDGVQDISQQTLLSAFTFFVNQYCFWVRSTGSLEIPTAPSAQGKWNVSSWRDR
jgi:hypothetical protein